MNPMPPLPESPRIPVFYSPRMVAQMEGYSPSAYKPRLVADALAASGLPIQIFEPNPVSVADFERVHSPAFVRGILSCAPANGFGDQDPEVVKSLPYTCGSLLDAARAATPNLPAASLSSGFHHAGYACCQAFCTFNGLMIAAAALLANGHTQRVAIVDADMHIGDGTDDILIMFPELNAQVLHISMGRKYHRREHAPAYLDTMRQLDDVFRNDRPDVILYQAGADPQASKRSKYSPKTSSGLPVCFRILCQRVASWSWLRAPICPPTIIGSSIYLSQILIPARITPTKAPTTAPLSRMYCRSAPTFSSIWATRSSSVSLTREDATISPMTW